MLLRIVLFGVALAAAGLLAGCGGSSASPGKVARAAAGRACDDSGLLHPRFNGAGLIARGAPYARAGLACEKTRLIGTVVLMRRAGS